MYRERKSDLEEFFITAYPIFVRRNRFPHPFIYETYLYPVDHTEKPIIEKDISFDLSRKRFSFSHRRLYLAYKLDDSSSHSLADLTSGDDPAIKNHNLGACKVYLVGNTNNLSNRQVVYSIDQQGNAAQLLLEGESAGTMKVLPNKVPLTGTFSLASSNMYTLESTQSFYLREMYIQTSRDISDENNRRRSLVPFFPVSENFPSSFFLPPQQNLHSQREVW